MKKHVKRTALAAAMVVVSVCFASQAFAWGSATHAYICDHLASKGPARNLNEIYGGMAPDVFNYLFSDKTLFETLYRATHYSNFTDVYRSKTIFGRALALGFVSHNGVWGADSYAHGFPYNNPDGYVIGKAIEMRFKYGAFMEDGGKVDPNDQNFWLNIELYHNAIESAVDILVSQHDRTLGAKIAAAALARTPEFPNLLVKAYGPLANNNENLIRSVESDFRRNLIAYGYALMQPLEKGTEDIASQLASMAQGFLIMNGVPQDLIFNLGNLDDLAYNIVSAALDECSSDYLPAVQQTIKKVSTALKQNGIID